jgi:hypothetical protein
MLQLQSAVLLSAVEETHMHTICSNEANQMAHYARIDINHKLFSPQAAKDFYPLARYMHKFVACSRTRCVCMCVCGKRVTKGRRVKNFHLFMVLSQQSICYFFIPMRKKTSLRKGLACEIEGVAVQITSSC